MAARRTTVRHDLAPATPGIAVGDGLDNMAPGQPIALTAIAFVVAALVILASDRLALSPGLRDAASGSNPIRLADLVARILVILPVFAFFFAISWRPVYSAGATISFFVIFTAISRAKLQFVREPLVFADIALLALVFRHKELFSATWLDALFFAGAATYVFGASTLFYVFEPTVLPVTGGWLPVVGMVAAALVPWLALLVTPIREAAARIAARLMAGDPPVAVTWRLGTFGSVLYAFLEWLGGREPEAQLPLPARLASVGTSPLVVVWQSESFYDMRHFGLPVSLPNLDRLRERSFAWGRMSSVFEGGYTLRTEFAVLSGMAPSALGPDSHYPYLRPLRFAGRAWPDRFRRAGWNTHFLHPYDRRFFSRDTALPAMGFEKLTMLDDFAHDPARDGQYVPDMALARRVLDAARHRGEGAGAFIFAASMENHGPWKPGRRDGLTDPVDIYTAILERSDAALGHLVDTLDGMDRPVWLIFYGDHAPILKSFADPFPDPRTDYVIVPLGASTRPTDAPSPAEIPPWRLIETLVSHMHAPGPTRRSA